MLNLRLFAAFLCVMAATAAKAASASLACTGPAAAEPSAERLCAALQTVVRDHYGLALQRSPGVQEGALLRLELQKAISTAVTARLSWRSGAGQGVSPVLDLVATDTDRLSDEALADFAETLLSLTEPPLPQFH
ncbi:hypothetical protein [Cereibacter sphaeroides]|uniref:hypothetical protein n=1 Tax=Cereibacter sphaeroides TaxID=1063 RepID=UPI001F34D68C|nr:hypothetical protein [Cereibacter sphaeroides]